MTTRLRLYFGGLCLLVEEVTGGAGADTGFYAALPVNTKMPHTPLFLYKDWNTNGGSANAWGTDPITPPLTIDLKRSIPAGPGGFTTPDRFLHVSRHVAAPVDSDCLDHAHGCVAVLVKLPCLHAPIEPYGDLARLLVVGQMTADKSLEWVAGYAVVEYPIASDTISINGKDLHAHDGLIEAGFANVITQTGKDEAGAHMHREDMASPPAKTPHQVGDEVEHQRCYYDLLRRGTATTANGGIAAPRFFVETTSPEKPWITLPVRTEITVQAASARTHRSAAVTASSLSGHATYEPAHVSHPQAAAIDSSGQYTPRSPGEIRSIIVEECTVGIGCPPSTPSC